MLCQSGRDSEAALQLATLDYHYRLAPEVLNYALPSEASAAAAAATPPPNNCVWIQDNALSPRLLRFMQRALAPTSAFWSEHDYDIDGSPRPYFSYLHALPDVIDPPRAAQTTMMEELLAAVYKLAVSQYPEVKDANFVEWWTHCRPHSSGHQFHFDSEDEGRGGVRHPIISTVLYLTPGGLGGPTLVTDQTLKKEQLASKGWLVHPRENRLAGFDGTLLHGVVPGRGVPQLKGSEGESTGAETETYGSARRITFMTAFWRGPMSTVPRADKLPGSSQPLPSAETVNERGYTWPGLFVSDPDEEGKEEARQAGVVDGVSAPVSRVWAPVDEEEEQEAAPMPHYDKCFQGF